ncbi:MAG: DUF4058 family protein [Rhizonema sp. NSF051]|nr:DUF4058 family protein [Rhizonema sp. NSF051]
MHSPFPRMNSYLENPVFWAEVHHRLITAIADAIEPNLPLDYRVGIEKRTYLSDNSDSILVDISDVSVFSQQSLNQQHSSTTTQVSTADAITITMPMPENVTQSYLEIREVKTDFAITVIEILSTKNIQ